MFRNPFFIVTSILVFLIESRDLRADWGFNFNILGQQSYSVGGDSYRSYYTTLDQRQYIYVDNKPLTEEIAKLTAAVRSTTLSSAEINRLTETYHLDEATMRLINIYPGNASAAHLVEDAGMANFKGVIEDRLLNLQINSVLVGNFQQALKGMPPLGPESLTSINPALIDSAKAGPLVRFTEAHRRKPLSQDLLGMDMPPQVRAFFDSQDFQKLSKEGIYAHGQGSLSAEDQQALFNFYLYTLTRARNMGMDFSRINFDNFSAPETQDELFKQAAIFHHTWAQELGGTEYQDSQLAKKIDDAHRMERFDLKEAQFISDTMARIGGLKDLCELFARENNSGGHNPVYKNFTRETLEKLGTVPKDFDVKLKSLEAQMMDAELEKQAADKALTDAQAANNNRGFFSSLVARNPVPKASEKCISSGSNYLTISNNYFSENASVSNILWHAENDFVKYKNAKENFDGHLYVPKVLGDEDEDVKTKQFIRLLKAWDESVYANERLQRGLIFLYHKGQVSTREATFEEQLVEAQNVCALVYHTDAVNWADLYSHYRKQLSPQDPSEDSVKHLLKEAENGTLAYVESLDRGRKLFSSFAASP